MIAFQDPEPMNIMGITFKATDDVGNRIWMRVVADPAYMEHRGYQAMVDRGHFVAEDFNYRFPGKPKIAKFADRLAELHRDAVLAVHAIVNEELARE